MCSKNYLMLITFTSYVFEFDDIWCLVIWSVKSTNFCAKICVLNHQIAYISLNICRMWYCCVFILILQKTAKSGKNGEVWKTSRGPRHSRRGSHHALTRPQTRRSSAHWEAQTRGSHHIWCGSRQPIPKTNQRWKQGPIKEKSVKEGYKTGFLAKDHIILHYWGQESNS